MRRALAMSKITRGYYSKCVAGDGPGSRLMPELYLHNMRHRDLVAGIAMRGGLVKDRSKDAQGRMKKIVQLLEKVPEPMVRIACVRTRTPPDTCK